MNRVRLRKDAWRNGTPGTDRHGNEIARVKDFGRIIGVGGKGGFQTRVKTIMDSKGQLHGYPDGPERP